MLKVRAKRWTFADPELSGHDVSSEPTDQATGSGGRESRGKQHGGTFVSLDSMLIDAWNIAGKSSATAKR